MPQSEYWKIVLGDFNVILLCIVMSARSNTDASDLVYVMLFFFAPWLLGLLWPICSTLSYIYVFIWHSALSSPSVLRQFSPDTAAPFHLWKKCMLCYANWKTLNCWLSVWKWLHLVVCLTALPPRWIVATIPGCRLPHLRPKTGGMGPSTLRPWVQDKQL